MNLSSSDTASDHLDRNHIALINIVCHRPPCKYLHELIEDGLKLAGFTRQNGGSSIHWRPILNRLCGSRQAPQLQ